MYLIFIIAQILTIFLTTWYLRLSIWFIGWVLLVVFYKRLKNEQNKMLRNANKGRKSVHKLSKANNEKLKNKKNKKIK